MVQVGEYMEMYGTDAWLEANTDSRVKLIVSQSLRGSIVQTNKDEVHTIQIQIQNFVKKRWKNKDGNEKETIGKLQ